MAVMFSYHRPLGSREMASSQGQRGRGLTTDRLSRSRSKYKIRGTTNPRSVSTWGTGNVQTFPELSCAPLSATVGHKPGDTRQKDTRRLSFSYSLLDDVFCSPKEVETREIRNRLENNQPDGAICNSSPESLRQRGHHQALGQLARVSAIRDTDAPEGGSDKKMVEDPAQAEKFVRETMKQGVGAGAKAKAEADSVATQFERFKRALKEEVSRDMGTGNSNNSSSSSRRRRGTRK